MMARVALGTTIFAIVAAFGPLLAAALVVGTKRLPPDGTANDVLCDLLASKDTTTRVVLEGYVTKRRAIGRSLAFLDVVPSNRPRGDEAPHPDFESTSPVQAILRREFWSDGDGGTDAFDVFHKILQPGVCVELTGRAGPSRIAGEGMLFCRSAIFKIANSNPQHLRNLLRYARDGFVDPNHVARALPGIEKGELMDGLSRQDVTCGELAAKLLSKVPKGRLLNPSHLMGATSAQKVALLPPVPHEYSTPPVFKSENIIEKQKVVSIATALEWKQRTKEQHWNEGTASSSKWIPFTLSGWVQNRRRFQDSVSVLELVDEFSSLASSQTATADNVDKLEDELSELWKRRIYAVLHPGALSSSGNEDSSNPEPAEIYGNILCAGARVMVQGYLAVADASVSGEEKYNAATFWATGCRLLRSSWRPGTVRHLLDLLHEGIFKDAAEAANALELPGGYAQAEDIARGKTEAADRRWMAAELMRSLQGENSRVGKISTTMRSSLDFFAHVRERYPLEEVNLPPLGNDNSESAKAAAILSRGNSLRSPPEGSRWQRAKRPQLEWMVNQISAVLRSHPDFGERKLKIVDIGGGKGLLSNLLAETFGNETVEVRVIDISTSATRNGMMRAKRLGLSNIQFDSRDATMLDVESGVDVVVALHACGALSDVALGHAAIRGAGFVVCPCCFRSNPHLRVSIPSDGGVELVTAEEWMGANATMYEPLKRLAELQGDMNMAGRAMHTICGLRAAAVKSRWQSHGFPGAEISTTIKSFPIGFSTRNICLVGKYSPQQPSNE